MAETLFGELAREIARYRNRHFLKAAMAAAALVAFADGVVRLAERYEIDALLDRFDALNLYDPHKAIAILDEYLDALRETPDDARPVLQGKLARVADDPKAARLILAIAEAVSAADGEVTESERAVLGEIARTMGRDR